MNQPDFCNVDMDFMVRILDGYTFKIGCKHRTLAVVTTHTTDGVTYVTLLLDDQDVEFVLDGPRSKKLYQGVPPKSIPEAN